MAQDPKKYKSSRAKESNLEQIENISDINPESAIEMLEEYIRDANKRKQNEELSRAYSLLGDINFRQGLYSQALKHYSKAEKKLSKSATVPLADLYYKMGYVHYQLAQWDMALDYFMACKSLLQTESNILKCQQAIAAVYSMSGELDRAESLYDTLIEEYESQGDFRNQSLQQAELSKVYAKKKDVSRANTQIMESLSNYAKSPNQGERGADYEAVDQAVEEVVSCNRAVEDDEAAMQIINENIQTKEQFDIPTESQVSDKLEMADIYIEQNKLVLAESLIKEAEVDNVGKSPANESMILKKSSELSVAKGDYASALSSYKAFVNAREQEFIAIQEQLDQKQRILSGQQDIDLIEKDFEIEEKEADILKGRLRTQRLLIAFLSVLLGLAAVFGIIIFRNIRERRKANQLLLLRSLRTQMNPHFIFNALNSVNAFVSQNDERAANKFLADFSTLMRTILDQSKEDLIPLSQELDMLELYLKLEHYRFRDKFDYTLEVDPEANPEDFMIPPMLMQPYVENAIWHGLRYKETKGELKVQINTEGQDLSILITDDGIGRKRSQEIKTKHQNKHNSTGIKNTEKRIELIREVYGQNYQVEISDLSAKEKDVGTRVALLISKS
jgi:tetratricopeptide (TPR) repeat protein